MWCTVGVARDVSNPYFAFDPDLCIVCSRCVRACDETQGTLALTVDCRGFGSRIVASQDEPFLTSECVSCGACVEACPTAALSEKTLAAAGQPDRTVTTTCGYCGVGCSLNAEVQGDAVVRMVPEPPGRRKRGSRLRQGAVRLRLRHARRPRHDTDDPPQDHGSRGCP